MSETTNQPPATSRAARPADGREALPDDVRHALYIAWLAFKVRAENAEDAGQTMRAQDASRVAVALDRLKAGTHPTVALVDRARLATMEADAARYRFLRDNPLGLRAVDGNASPKSTRYASIYEQQLDEHVDAAQSARAAEGDHA